MKNDAALARLLEAARNAEPEPYSADEAAALVDRALDAAEEPAAYTLPERRLMGPIVAVAAAILLAVGAYSLWPSQAEPVASISRLMLPSGDQIVAAPGARFEVERANDQARRIRIDDGSMLFDVDPLRESETFEVDTPGVKVRVRGTVFSVQTRNSVTVVRVYEGQVEVEHSGVQRMLRRDEVWASSTRVSRPDDELERLGLEAAERRDRARPEVAVRAAPERAALAEELSEPEPVDSPARVEEPSSVEPAPIAPRRTRETSRGLAAPAAPTPAPDLREATRLLALGQYQAALDASEVAIQTDDSSGAWLLLRADSLRGLRRFGEAADGYDRAAGVLGGVRELQAGFKGAQLRFQHLQDPAGALASLERSGAWGEGSPLQERALGLRVRALHRLGRDAEASGHARTYLERFPHAALSEWMQRLIDGSN